MARPTTRLVFALRKTAARLRQGSQYKWSNFGHCNCGHLAQTITDLDARTIHEAAFSQSGDWGQQARDYCQASGLPIARVIREMLDVGLHVTDLEHIERLSHPDVLKALPEGRRLHHTSREDTIFFMELWADLLMAKLTKDKPELAQSNEPDAERNVEAKNEAKADVA